MADKIIYSSSTAGLSSEEIASIGKIQTPIRMVIEHESDALAKKGGARDWLFNVEKSHGFGDTIVGGNEFPEFSVTGEGAAAAKVSAKETYKKFIENYQFMEEFEITAKMIEDSHFGLAADAKRRAESFTRAYYRTMNKICESALANGTSTALSLTGSDSKPVSLDISTADGKALFAKDHAWGAGAGTQANYFAEAGAFASAEALEEVLAELAIKIRNMKDENGYPMGYTADTIVLPGNASAAERLVKKVCGTDQPSGNGSYINTQYGNWRVIVLPTWQISSGSEILVMSSEANKNLGGNMFFNRVPLSVRDFIDVHTSNYIWTGRCRFGVGFGTYKHIVKLTTAEDSAATTL
jgi:hypothetical protein